VNAPDADFLFPLAGLVGLSVKQAGQGRQSVSQGAGSDCVLALGYID
jgi:hypothetical protein